MRVHTLSVSAVLFGLLAACDGSDCGCHRSKPASPAAPAVPSAKAEPGKPFPVKGAGYEGTVLHREWSPSEDDVKRLEAGFGAAYRKALPDTQVPLTAFYRQYVGVVENGRRLVHVHGFRGEILQEDAARLRQEEVHVYDGGDYYLEAAYDPATGAFEQVGFHGEA